MKAEITKDELTKLGKLAKAEKRTILLYDTELPRFGARATKTGFVSYIPEYNLGGRDAPNRRDCNASWKAICASACQSIETAENPGS